LNSTSLSRRLPLAMAVVAVTAVGIAVLVAWPLFIRASEASTRATLSRTADLTAGLLERSASSNSPIGPSVDRLDDLLATQRVRAYLVRPGSDPGPPFMSMDVDSVTSGRPFSARRSSLAGTYFVEGRPVSASFGVLLIQSSDVARELARPALLRLLGALALGLAVAVVVGSVLARRITAPLAATAAAAGRIAAGGRDVTVAPDGPKEVADLAIALNGLCAALAESEGRQREFFLAVSHELRTPLTSIKGYAEALSDSIVPPERVGEVLELVRSEADHLDRLVADLLDLARVGAIDLKVAPTDFDLGDLATEAAAVWGARAQRLGIDFRTELLDLPLRVHTDRVRLRQIIDNLMENALRLTEAGSPVVLRVSRARTSTSFIVEVRDGGPGLSEEDRAVAFLPGELHARYLGVRKVGSGVGLALVDRLAAKPEGGAAFRVMLPAAGPLGPTG
jgi:two-component system, OmpR family, sensor kinase